MCSAQHRPCISQKPVIICTLVMFYSNYRFEKIIYFSLLEKKNETKEVVKFQNNLVAEAQPRRPQQY